MARETLVMLPRFLTPCGWCRHALVEVGAPGSTGICAACADALRTEARALLSTRGTA